ncbi:MAG: hypothetical protein SA339_00330 [Methanomassiliicoccus sp.]|nr:hypothetical protein [Methanomassiliicoccus sp.]
MKIFETFQFVGPSVRAPHASPLVLLMVASVSIAALMALSDFNPVEMPQLRDLDADAATMTLVVLECRICTGGYLLELADGVGGEARAFCPAHLLSTPLDRGSTVTITVMRSSDDPSFLFVQEISLPPTGKD